MKLTRKAEKLLKELVFELSQPARGTRKAVKRKGKVVKRAKKK